jgi:hypothetical protein
MHVTIRDEVIWVKHLPDKALGDQISTMKEGTTVELEIDGVRGTWERMRTGRDGRPTLGIKPVGAMRDVWKHWRQNRNHQTVSVKPVSSVDGYLSAMSSLFVEWNSAEDEVAFRDL